MNDIRLLGNQRIDQKTYDSLLKHIKLKVTEEYTYPPKIITCGGSTIATLGNFSATVGKPKSKKTFNVSAMVAAAISGKMILGYEAHLPEDRKKVLYIDTEQSQYHCHKVLERILKLADLPLDEECRLIDFFALREYTPEQRKDIISLALQADSRYSLVVIDGIRDLIRDINNPSESLDIINDYMRWTSCYNIHIHTVLHLNKGDDNTRGHVGSEMNNKAESVLQVTKNIDDSSMSEVRPMLLRDKDFAPFAFRIGEDGLPYNVDGYNAELNRRNKKTHYTRLTEQQHREALESVLQERKPYGYSEMIKLLTEGYANIGYSRGRNTIISLLRFLIECALITKVDKTYVYIKKNENVTVSIADNGLV